MSYFIGMVPLMVSTRLSAALIRASTGVTLGMVKYLCLKNTVSQIRECLEFEADDECSSCSGSSTGGGTRALAAAFLPASLGCPEESSIEVLPFEAEDECSLSSGSLTGGGFEALNGDCG